VESKLPAVVLAVIVHVPSAPRWGGMLGFLGDRGLAGFPGIGGFGLGFEGEGRNGANGSGIPPFLARSKACFSASLLVTGRPVSPIPIARGTERTAAGKTIPPPAAVAGAAAAAGIAEPGGSVVGGETVGALRG
jgi:hypothetical protein